MNSPGGAARVIVVGGGVLGTMHAVAARSRGFEVVHLEREPDARGLPLTALLRLGGGAVTELATIGDTPSDVESGLRAGAAIAAGVLTGSASREELTGPARRTSWTPWPASPCSASDRHARRHPAVRVRSLL